ncbi:MAG: small multi-drug export protein [candidate division KSB1 bacterium]|nr:small multi-drug export protein [candidate division KSB1 bacterium]
MVDQLVQWFSGLPKTWITALLSMLPVTELRAAIPWALAGPPYGGGLPWYEALAFAALGNMVPVVPLLLLLEHGYHRLKRHPWWDRAFEKVLARTRQKGKVVEKYRALGLALFVGVPLPGTGAWTGALAAFVFGIPFRYALPAIAAGVLIAGIVVTLASLGIIGVFRAI